VIGLLASAYLASSTLRGALVPSSRALTLWICGIFLVLSIAILAAALRSTTPSVARRVAGTVLDNGATTLILLLHPQTAAPFFVIYLWVSFGNGFRYGLPYLALSTALSVAGFVAVSVSRDLWHSSPHYTAGVLIGLVVLPAYVASLLRRLTRVLAEAEAANVAKTQFLANISHEIRTPLHGILGLGELVLGSRLDPRQRRLAEISQRSASRLLEIVNEVLDFSKVEAEGITLRPAAFELRRLVHDVVDLHGEASRAKGLAVTCEMDPALPAVVSGAALRLGQVLSNLVGNAVKFTETGSVTVRVTPQDLTASQAVIGFEIEDTGIGIEPSAARRIFTPFSQADGSTTRRYGGTGLGLPLASRLVAAMGGEVGFVSSPGVGTTFRFTLRMGVEDAVPLAAAEPRDQPPPRNALRWRRTPRVLAVEDNEVNLELLAQFLASFGCIVEVARNGKEAVEACRRAHFDVVMMDCQMPEMDGYQSAAAIRAQEREASAGEQRTAILALTAHAGPDDRARCLAAGMDDYLSKPFGSDDLLAVLVRWVPQDEATGPTPVLPLFPADLASGNGERSEAPPRQTAHDLRNLLLAVIGNAELGEINTPKGSPERERFGKVLVAARQAAVLLKNDLPGGNPDSTGP
jgi:two-component system, sensor histidine kinase RpfC